MQRSNNQPLQNQIGSILLSTREREIFFKDRNRKPKSGKERKNGKEEKRKIPSSKEEAWGRDVYVSSGQARVLPRKVERRPGCGERPPWPVGPSQTVRRTGRCRGRSPSCCRRHQHRHRRRRRLHPLRPCTASRRPHAPTDLGNPGCTGKDQAPEINQCSKQGEGKREKFWERIKLLFFRA